MRKVFELAICSSPKTVLSDCYCETPKLNKSKILVAFHLKVTNTNAII
jgi:hypothetical protein